MRLVMELSLPSRDYFGMERSRPIEHIFELDGFVRVHGDKKNAKEESLPIPNCGIPHPSGIHAFPEFERLLHLTHFGLSKQMSAPDRLYMVRSQFYISNFEVGSG